MYVGTLLLFMIVLYSVLWRGFKWEFSDPNVANRDSVSKGQSSQKLFQLYKFLLDFGLPLEYNGAGPKVQKFKVYHLLAPMTCHLHINIGPLHHWRGA